MESNAWDRAQEAIARAEQRDDSVVTPDNAVSPFDASATTIIAVPRSGTAPRGRHQRPDPRGGSRPPTPGRPRGAGRPGADEPPTTPVDVSDPHLVPVAVGPEVDAADTEDLRPGARVTTTRPPTAPFAAAAPYGLEEADEAGAPPARPTGASPTGGARRPWWKRWFGRR